MPTWRDGSLPDGRPRFVRAYDRGEYTVPPGAIEALRAGSEAYGSTTLLADGRDGPFAPFEAFCCFVREGARWIALWNWMERWAIEVELTDERLGDIRPLPPEASWHIAVALDDDGVRVEGPTPERPQWLW
jgi:hypothetical protein